LGFNLALRKLPAQNFVSKKEIGVDRANDSFDGIVVTEAGWQWIEANESRFILHRPDRKSEDTLPF